MKLNIFFILSAGLLLLSGCVNINVDNPPVNQNTVNKAVCGNNICELGETTSSCATDCGTNSEGNNDPSDTAPLVSSVSTSPSNPAMQQSFTLSVTANDDKRVKYILWESSKPVFSGNETVALNSDYYECSSQTSCSYSWNLKSDEEGLIEINVYAEDSSGNESAKSRMEINVQAFEKPDSVCGNGTCETGESSDNCSADCGEPEPSCGDGTCNEDEAYEICAADCPRIDSVCGNGTCEGGESGNSCSSDCTGQEIIGTNPADGACQPGEDINNAPKDCTDIKPNCGNGVCDSWETYEGCYEDCLAGTGGDSDGESCTSNAGCGYKKICQSGTCVSVDCTNDSQCSGCRKCVSYQCVSCGYGPEGYCTCIS